MDELKALIADLRNQLAELKAGEVNEENASKILELRTQLKNETAKLATFEEAYGDAEVDVEPATPTAEGGEGEGGEAEGDGAEGGEAAPAEAAPAEAAPAEATGPVALAAGGAAVDVSPTAGETGDEVTTGPRPMVLTASAGTAGVMPGNELTRELALKVLQASHAAGGRETNGNVRMLEIERWGADAEALHDNRSAIVNTRMIREARSRFIAGEQVRPATLTAGGCFCGPDELIKEAGVEGRRGRPVASSLPSIPISGGFRAIPDLAFNVDNTGSVYQWTCTDQDNVDDSDDSTWKQCTELDCFTENEYVPYMVVGCTTVRRQHRWAHPEQVDAWINLLGIEYDSVAETLLLDKLAADAGTALTVGAAGDLMEQHGLYAKLIYALGNLDYPLSYEFRSGGLEGFVINVPRGFTKAVLADEQLRGFPSGVRTAGELVARLADGYGVRLIERMDEETSRKAAAATTVTELNDGGPVDDAGTDLLPPTFRTYIYDPTQWVHGEGTLVGADWHVDTALLRRNKMQYFLENVEIAERLGPRKTHMLDIPGVISGSYTDLVPQPIP